MSYKERLALFTDKVGHVASLSVEDISVKVRILEIRQSFGRVDLKVTPVSGDGEIWVNSERVIV